MSAFKPRAPKPITPSAIPPKDGYGMTGNDVSLNRITRRRMFKGVSKPLIPAMIAIAKQRFMKTPTPEEMGTTGEKDIPATPASIAQDLEYSKEQIIKACGVV